MTIQVSQTEHDRLGLDLAASVDAFRSALAAHAQSEGQPAPVAHPLVEMIVRSGVSFEVVPDPAPPVVSEIDRFRRAIQAHIDAAAQARRYDSGASCASYAASTVPAWAAEAHVFIAWRDGVWAYAYTEMAKVEAGERDQPTVEDFLGELPMIAWPA